MISVIGTGKLGACMVAFYASHGYKVCGIDSNKELIDNFSKGNCPIQEPELKELLGKYKENIVFSSEYENVVNSDMIFIIVPTPSDENGEFKNDFIINAIKNIAPIIKDCNKLPLVVVTSTVMPFSMDKVIKPELEKLVGREVNICYNPEFIALGSVIKNMRYPDAILIGESSRKAGDILEEFYKDIYGCQEKVKIARMNLINSEVAKIALNTYVTTKISLANTYEMICEIIPKGNVDAITNFLGLDSRIGSKYFKGGLGFSGECFPRDCKAFGVFSHKLGIETPIQEATDKLNNLVVDMVVNKASKILKKGSISVLGLSFKPNTPVVTCSQSIMIIKKLLPKYKIKVYDPMALDNAKKVLDDSVTYCENATSCLYDTELCIIATEWEEFKNMPYNYWEFMKFPRILDCWRMLDSKKIKSLGYSYYALGINND